MIEDIIQDITISKNKGAYISALALALTLPNIFANIEYNKKTCKDKYIEWFNKWVYPYYEMPFSEHLLINQGIENSKFDGDNCYALRCALLHSGNTNLKDQKNGKIDTFTLCMSKKSANLGESYISDVSPNGSGKSDVTLNVVRLIDCILAGVLEYMSKNQEKMEQNNKLDYNKIFGGITIEYI